MRARSLGSRLRSAIRPVLTSIFSRFGSRGRIRPQVESLEERRLLSTLSYAGDDSSNAWYLCVSPTDSTHLQLFDHSTPTGEAIYDGLRREIDELIISGNGGNDTLIVDFSSGVPIRTNVLSFDGGAGSDSIQIIGNPLFSGTYDPTAFGSGSATIFRKKLAFSGIEAISAQDLKAFTLATDDADDHITIDKPEAGQTRFRDSTATPAFAPLTIGSVDKAVLDSSAGNGSSCDQIILQDTGLSSSQNLIIAAGTAAAGQNNTLTVTGGVTNFHAGWGTSGGRLAVTVQNSAVLNFAATQYLASLTLEDSAAAKLPTGLFKVLVVDALAIPSTSATLDVGDNDLILHNAAVGTIQSLIQRGYNGGNWQGSGITSSAAAASPASYDALGVMQNQSYSTFDGQTVATADVLVKYVYAGDADLSGLLDGSDYAQIDRGYLNRLSGWFNGDFDYSGTIDGSDYFLIDRSDLIQNARPKPPMSIPATASVDEGTEYTLNLQAPLTYTVQEVVDYDANGNEIYGPVEYAYDPISYWTVDWGDGTVEAVIAQASGDTMATHAYADDGSYTLSVSAKGSLLNYWVGTQSVQVNEVAPDLGVAGEDHAHEGEEYTLSFSPYERGDDEITLWTVNWGDGTGIETYPGDIEAVTHTYADPSNSITVTATDEDSTYIQTNDFAVLPSAPDAISATPGSGTVALGWVDHSGMESSFDIQQSLTGDDYDWFTVGTAAANASSLVANGPFAPDTTYYFRVLSRVGTVSCESSASVSITTPAFPDYPTYVTATSEAGAVRLSWWHANRAQQYDIYADGALVDTVNDAGEGTSTEFLHAGLDPGETHVYWVVARSSLTPNWSSWPSCKVRGSAMDVPSVPQNLAARVQGDCVQLDWTRVPGVSLMYNDKYVVHRRDADSREWTWDVWDWTGAWNNFPVSVGTYSYAVEALNAAGSSDLSPWITVTVTGGSGGSGDVPYLAVDSNNDRGFFGNPGPQCSPSEWLVHGSAPGLYVPVYGVGNSVLPQMKLYVPSSMLEPGDNIKLVYPDSLQIRTGSMTGWGNVIASGTAYSMEQVNGGTLYIEGLRPAANQEITFYLQSEGSFAEIDSVIVTLFGTEINADSNNDGQITAADDSVEDAAGQPGRLVVVNDGDVDGDGIVDWADGFNWDRAAGFDDLCIDDSESPTNLFAPVQITIPASVDLSVARLRILYGGSGSQDTHPAHVMRLPSYTPGQPPTYGLPQEANMRLWTQPSYAARSFESFRFASTGSGLGYYVPPTWWDNSITDDYYGPADLEKLGFDGSRTITLYVEALQQTSFTIDVEIDPDGEGPTWFIATDSIQLTGVDLNLRVDTDRDGSISEADERNKRRWESGNGKPGALVLPNCDKDNTTAAPDNWIGGNWNGTDVPANTVIDNDADLADTAPLQVKQFGINQLPANMTVILKVEKPQQEDAYFKDFAAAQRVRIFVPAAGRTAVQAGDEAVIGLLMNGPDVVPTDQVEFVAAPTGSQRDYDIFKGNGTLEFRIEGIEPGAMVDIVLTVAVGQNVLKEDKVRMRVAPFVLNDNRNGVAQGQTGAETIFVSGLDYGDPDPVGLGGDNLDLRELLYGKYNDAVKTDEGSVVMVDPWQQDGYEIGYAQAPYGQMPIVLELPRSYARDVFGNVLQYFIRTELLRANVGVYTGLTTKKWFDADDGGNIESLPIPGGGPGYFFYGEGMSPEIPAFFNAMGVNSPLAIDTSWLLVGHVDELVFMAPDGEHLVVADSELAWALLLRANEIDPDARMLQSMNGFDAQGIAVGDIVGDTFGKDINQQFVPGKMADVLSIVTNKTEAKLPVSEPQPGSANAGNLKLQKAGAYVDSFGDFEKREYQIVFLDADNYKVRFRHVSDPWPIVWEYGNRTVDEIFPSSGIFIFSYFWSGGPPQADDEFTFTVDPGAEIVSIPALYFRRWSPAEQKWKIWEYTVDQVNAFIDGGTIITGKSWGPTFDGHDILQDYCQEAFVRAGFSSTGVLFADESYYHNRDGSIHCGTNVIRNIPSTKWWEYAR